MEPHEEKYPYPAGFEHIADKVAIDVERIRVIDAEIERLHTAPEPGPQPRLTPAGEPAFRQPTNAELTAYLKTQKEQIQKESFESVDKEAAREKNPTTQRVLRDAARNELYGNPYEGMSDGQMRTIRQQQGRIDLEQSADYMEARRSRTPEKPATAPVEPFQAAAPEKGVFLSPTQHAMQSLTYTRITEKADNVPAKSKAEFEVPQDKQEPEKLLLPSEMASLSLNYTVMTQHADSLREPATDKALEPALDKDGPDLNP